MFPTTVWDLVREAGASDPVALERFATDYRAPVLRFIRLRGASANDADDLCQDVFLRLLAGGVLAKADASKGSFRNLLRIVTVRVIQDWRRRKRDVPADLPEPTAPEPDFDQAWALHLAERALDRLKEESPSYFAVIERHVDEQAVDRNKLWIARRKLSALVRREIALTCRTPEESAAEYRALLPYLQKK